MNKTNSKTVLSIGFGTILVLLVVMTVNWLNYIQQTTERVEDILKEQQETELVFQMRDSAHMRTLILHRIALLNDSFDRDDEYIHFKELASVFIQARDALVDMGMNTEEAKIWEAAKEYILKGGKTQLDTVEHFLEDRDDIARDLLLNVVTPTQNLVMTELTKMLDIQRGVMQRAAKETVITSENTYGMVLVLGVLTFLVGSSIAIFTIRSSSRNERELIQTQQAAESASQYKSLFLANMSHEIRTPLTAVIGYAESLLNPGLQQNSRHEYTNTIIRNGKHLLQVINDILDLSKIEANKLDVEIINVCPLEIVTEVESVMGQIAREKGLDFQIQYIFPFPETIDSDPTRLKQILLNITSNAIKFTEQGNITINCGYDAINNQMSFTIVDTGIGMDSKAIEQIFNPFSQADASTTRKYGGTGLGLTISRQLANMLGGDLQCTSQPGKGTRFTLTINPGKIDDEKMLFSLPAGWSASNQHNSTEALHVQGNILLAEDSPDIQGLVSMYITRTGASVTAVDNGQLAVEAAMANDYDLILMDMQMPVMDGIQATKWLRSTGYDGKIVALTANAMKEDRQRFQEAGIDDFLAKPIDLTQFYLILGKYLHKIGKQTTNTLIANEPSQIEDEDDFMAELISNFKQRLPGIMLEFSDALEEQDTEALRQVAHRLKGMGGSFGFPEITEVSAKIESFATEQEINQAEDEFRHLNEMCREINHR